MNSDDLDENDYSSSLRIEKVIFKRPNVPWWGWVIPDFKKRNAYLKSFLVDLIWMAAVARIFFKLQNNTSYCPDTKMANTMWSPLEEEKAAATWIWPMDWSKYMVS